MSRRVNKHSIEYEKTRRYATNQYWSDGNTVPKRKPVKIADDNHIREVEKPRTVYKKRKPVMSRLYMAFLCISAITLIIVCFYHMRVEKDLNVSNRQIVASQNDLKMLQEENTALRDSLNITMDLDHIYQIATEDFNMVYAVENQIIYYDSSNDDYIRQFESLTKASE